MVMRGLFTVAEIDELCAEFAALHAAGPVPGHFEPRATGAAGTGGPEDPLAAHPQVVQPGAASTSCPCVASSIPGCGGSWRSCSARRSWQLRACSTSSRPGPGAGAAPGQLLSAGRAGHLRGSLDRLRHDRPGERRPGSGAGRAPHRPVLPEEADAGTVVRTGVRPPPGRSGHHARRHGTGRRAVLQRQSGARLRAQPRRQDPLPPLLHRPLRRAAPPITSAATTPR